MSAGSKLNSTDPQAFALFRIWQSPGTCWMKLLDANDQPSDTEFTVYERDREFSREEPGGEVDLAVFPMDFFSFVESLIEYRRSKLKLRGGEPGDLVATLENK